MAKKEKLVTLQVRDHLEDFEFTHAERILRMPRTGGWHLPPDSPYRLTKDGLKEKRNTRNSEESKAKDTSSESD